MRRLGYLIWAALAVLAAIFYPERAIFTDAAFQNFHMLQEEALYISHGRFGNVLPQLLPFLIMKLGIGVNGVLLAYSLSFILFFALIYHLLVRVLKNDYLGWSLILYILLLAYDSFFHVQSELYQGIAVMLLSFGVALQHPEKEWSPAKWGLLLILLFSLAFYHKLTLLFFGYVWGYFLIRDKSLRKWNFILLLPLMILLALVKSQLFQSAYEDNRMSILKQGLTDYFPNFWDMPANAKFLKKCLKQFVFFPILLFFLSFLYIRRKAFTKALWVIGGSLAYILLVHFSSPNTTFDFYSEVTYLPLGLLLGLPFIYDFLTPIYERNSRKIEGAIVAFLLIKVLFIIHVGSQYRNRLQSMNALAGRISAAEKTCCVRDYSEGNKRWLITTWGVAYESLLYSTIQSPERHYTLLVDDDFMEYYDDLQEGELFLAAFDRIPFGELNARFFRLAPGRYVKIE
ncbi:MAG: hypothetical protein GYB31_03880 [Bacteroidetes bacterium]|nr:hypothetical protein [Bacteroidota bacterium]